MLQDRQWYEIGVYQVPFSFQCIYGCSDGGGENAGDEKGGDISGGGGERADIAWPLVRK